MIAMINTKVTNQGVHLAVARSPVVIIIVASKRKQSEWLPTWQAKLFAISILPVSECGPLGAGRLEISNLVGRVY